MINVLKGSCIQHTNIYCNVAADIGEYIETLRKKKDLIGLVLKFLLHRIQFGTNIIYYMNIEKCVSKYDLG
jgi:hypothetical protein